MSNVIDLSGNTIKANIEGSVTNPDIEALTVIATVDAVDAATTQALANEIKAKVNDIINALKAS